MNPVAFIIRDAAGRAIRSGIVPLADVERQAGVGETVEPATPEGLAEVQAGQDQRKASLAAIRASQPQPATLEVVLEALRGKGIDLKPADLEAAAATLQARRTPLAGAGK